MINFLGKVGWSKKEIEEYVLKWNTEKNREPLREVYIRGQLAHFTPGERLPPNCNNDAYYKGIGIACAPDDHCKRLKNPVNFTLARFRRWLREKEEENEKKTRKNMKEEQKEKTEKANKEENSKTEKDKEEKRQEEIKKEDT
ncbi:hypothetical protein HYX13_02105 [Candidatus Woesearchaeota archaeon]|nr:hypothetical protein [Candidatus Woesearchaeota archaeon]